MPTTLSVMSQRKPASIPTFYSPVSSVQEKKDDYNGFMVQVMSGGSVEFTGEMNATGLENMRSVFWNDVGGSIE